jgi:hypothetical protein
VRCVLIVIGMQKLRNTVMSESQGHIFFWFFYLIFRVLYFAGERGRKPMPYPVRIFKLQDLALLVMLPVG